MPKKTTTARSKPNPEELRSLDLEISFMEGLVERDPVYFEALFILAEAYTRRERYVEGLRMDERLCQLRPHDPLVHYNLACSHSLTGQLDLAIETLKKSIHLGFADFNAIAKDRDLENLRENPEFKKICAKAIRQHAKET